jgi:hypothetical protein
MAGSDPQLIQANQKQSALLIKLSTIYCLSQKSIRYYVQHTSNIEAQFSDEHFRTGMQSDDDQ